MQVWSKIDFDTGKVIFLDATRKEDMLQVEYPNCFLLDMGWYQDRYIISVILKPKFLPQEAPKCTLMAATAISQAVFR